MENKNPLSNPVVIASIVVALLLCCCCIIILVGLGGAAFFTLNKQVAAVITEVPSIFVESTPTPTPVVELTRTPIEEIPVDTLGTLNDMTIPLNDLNELACRLRGQCNVAATLPAPGTPLVVGAEQTFWTSNSDTQAYHQVNARLEYITAHSYFWVEQGQTFNYGDLRKLADTFEKKIYPTDREFFGNEWTPGIDNDPHIYILFVYDLGSNVAGYFSSADMYNPAISKYSNGHEMFLFDLQNTPLEHGYAYTVLAHELQHMIHWYQDRNEDLWMNEGFADLAALLNGYDVGGADWAFIQDPDLQLNDWPNEPDNPYARTSHYGASFLYLAYLLDRFGEQVTKAVVQNPLNGLDSIDDTLRQLNITDSQTGKPITADDVFADWAVTNYLLDDSVGDGRFIYQNYPAAPQAEVTETISTCPAGAFNRNVHQYGTDYIRIECRGDFTLRFSGSTQTSLLPSDPYSGEYAFWSNKGDESDMTLTRQFDLSSVSGPVSLSYATWYDLETGYDYLYVEASTDGQTWQILQTPSGTDSDPIGNSYGWGYTGVSNGWLQESIDLSPFAGRTVWIRFEYITDAAVNGEGLLLDDLAIPAINYSTDFESDDGGWEAKGFARIENVLPQTFRITLITRGAETTVQYINLGSDQTADIPMNLTYGEDAILVVSGTTRFTRTEAGYSISVK